MRLDKYLKVSRLIKRRTVANDACDAGRVMINGKVGDGPYAEAQGDLISLLHLVGGPGGLTVDGDQSIVAGFVGHGPPLDEPGDLEIFV